MDYNTLGMTDVTIHLGRTRMFFKSKKIASSVVEEYQKRFLDEHGRIPTRILDILTGILSKKVWGEFSFIIKPNPDHTNSVDKNPTENKEAIRDEALHMAYVYRVETDEERKKKRSPYAVELEVSPGHVEYFMGFLTALLEKSAILLKAQEHYNAQSKLLAKLYQYLIEELKFFVDNIVLTSAFSKAKEKLLGASPVSTGMLLLRNEDSFIEPPKKVTPTVRFNVDDVYPPIFCS
jgi:hypothetical protein